MDGVVMPLILVLFGSQGAIYALLYKIWRRFSSFESYMTSMGCQSYKDWNNKK